MHFHDHGEDDDDLRDGTLTEVFLYSGDHIELTTVGIDIGSSTSHLIFSRLKLRRLGQQLSSRYVVVSREALYRSPILLTPYAADDTINVERLRRFVDQAYAEAGLTPADVDTGAIILTGEAVKRRNARAIAELFADEAGKFVCASAGHNLEAIMAAHGSGAVALSRETPGAVLNVDVGGGTSKLALIRGGEVLESAAINVGGRLIALDERGRLIRIEPAARTAAETLGIGLRLGHELPAADQERLAERLADCLFEVIRREQPSPLAGQLLLTPALASDEPIAAVTFSGGVAEYLDEREARRFGDLAPLLAAAIRRRIAAGRLPAPLRMPGERIRATVIGASQFTVQVSGNTITVSRPELLPIHNLQVLYPRLPRRDSLSAEEISQAIQLSFQRSDLEEGAQPVALAIDWSGTPSYQHLRSLADGIVRGLPRTVAAGLPLVLVFHHDFGALVGRILREEVGIRNDVIAIDSVTVKDFDYVDIGSMVAPARAVPVVIKSLVFPAARESHAELLES